MENKIIEFFDINNFEGISMSYPIIDVTEEYIDIKYITVYQTNLVSMIKELKNFYPEYVIRVIPNDIYSFELSSYIIRLYKKIKLKLIEV